MYGALLAVIASLPCIFNRRWFIDVAYVGDLGYFWSAGATVGTTALANVNEHYAWQTAHHLSALPFVYLPGFAWIYVPLAHLPLISALVAEELAMVLLFALAAWIASRVYGFPLWFAIVCVFAWGPVLSAIEVGQNTGLGLVLSLLAILALAKERQLFAGLAIGLLLFKPTEALPLILLLCLRRSWRALAIVIVCSIGWYVLSILATHGDWQWPATYARTAHAYYITGVPSGYWKAFTLPTLLLAIGVPSIVAFGSGLALIAISILPLVRSPITEAGSMAILVGVASSPYAWPYEATLLLPAVFFAMTRITEPWRTRAVVATYLVASIGMVTPHGAHSLAIICIGGALWWLTSQYLQSRSDARSGAR